MDLIDSLIVQKMACDLRAKATYYFLVFSVRLSVFGGFGSAANLIITFKRLFIYVFLIKEV